MIVAAIIKEGIKQPSIDENLVYQRAIYRPATDDYVLTFTKEQRKQFEMPKLDFKLALLENHNITDDMVKAGLDQIPDLQKREALKLKWFESRVIKKNDPDLLAMAPSFGLTTEDINAIFEQQ